MAHIQRTPKPGNFWTENELSAFNIQIELVDPPAFFGIQALPDPSISPVTLECERRPQAALIKQDRLFYSYLRGAMTGEKSMVVDFIAFLLGLIGFDRPERVIRQRKELPVLMCGHKVEVRPDVCLMTDTECLLVAHEDKPISAGGNPEPQVIADAIAAFYQNSLYASASGQPRLRAQTIPAITIVGTSITFYRVPVTTELLSAVQTGSFSPQITRVQKCVPPVPNMAWYPKHGLVPLENRRVVLQCLEAFKTLVVD